MIFFDTTRTAKKASPSGLRRVGERLLLALGDAARPLDWKELPSASPQLGDWFLTPELFDLHERRGFAELLARRPCRFAALFHDAIPLKHPEITWPQSVARHPGYLQLLSRFDRVWAVSTQSKEELLAYWRWMGLQRLPPVEVLGLGADFDGSPRRGLQVPPAGRPQVLCVGIVEPRKNQDFLLDLAEELWGKGLAFELTVVGRVNPHFGKATARRLRALAKRQPWLRFFEKADDVQLARLYEGARLTVFPSLAEGCGLPLLESLWRGLPCLASDLAPLRENAVGGGCVCIRTSDRASWAFALERLLVDEALWQRLATDAAQRPLPTWAAAALRLKEALGD